MRTELHQAVEAIDLETTKDLIEQIRRQNGPLADALAELVKEYRFDTLQALFEKSHVGRDSDLDIRPA